MQSTIEIDEKLKKALDERARDAGTSTSELAASFIRAGLERSTSDPRRSGQPAIGSYRVPQRSDRPRFSNGLPQLYLEPGTDVSLDTLTGILNAVEADDELGPPLAISPEIRAELMSYAREQGIPAGLFAARILQQSLLHRKEWPAIGGIPQVPSTNREPVTLEFVKQLQEELDLEDALG